MIAVDRAMVGDYGILLVQMMERAGRHLAHLARMRFLTPQARGHNAVVLAGPGGNGGGVLVCARCLATWGANVSVFVTGNKGHPADIPGQQLKIVQRMGIEVCDVGRPPSTPPDLIIDGIVGYSLRGALRGRSAELAEWSNRSSAPILALDIPSGLHASTGAATESAVRATATMTLALPKTGLRNGKGPVLVGELYLADIGVPPQLYGRPPLGLTVPNIFAQCDLVKLL